MGSYQLGITTQVFTYFSSLPQELQDQIWEEAIIPSWPRILTVSLVFPEESNSGGPLFVPAMWINRLKPTVSVLVPADGTRDQETINAIISTCREGRDAAVRLVRQGRMLRARDSFCQSPKLQRPPRGLLWVFPTIDVLYFRLPEAVARLVLAMGAAAHQQPVSSVAWPGFERVALGGQSHWVTLADDEVNPTCAHLEALLWLFPRLRELFLLHNSEYFPCPLCGKTGVRAAMVARVPGRKWPTPERPRKFVEKAAARGIEIEEGFGFYQTGCCVWSKEEHRLMLKADGATRLT